MSRAYRPDAQAFDEVRIKTMPRYKQSELSGDEWRISAVMEFYRNGELKHSSTFRNVETACGYAFSEHGRACEESAYFAGESGFCDQEGCSNGAQVRLEKLSGFCHYCGKEREYHMDEHRDFCNEHKVRGDCGIDDADRNYQKVDLVSADQDAKEEG